MNLITYLLTHKLAKNEPHARAKIVLLKLQDIAHDEAAVIARLELYEAWRKSRLYRKADRQACADKAILGVAVPEPIGKMFEDRE